jgi:hypothetical protein
VRSFCLILGLWVCGWLAFAARADSFQLTTGETVAGEILPSSGNEDGVQIKVGEGDYKKVPWGNFSQDDLKKLSSVPRLAQFVEPFIEISQQEKRQKTEVTIKPVPRLVRPQEQSFFGALFSSGLGLFIVLLVYAANVYAGYEVAIFRAQPVPMVCGLSAIPVLGFAVPIIYLCTPTKLPPRAAEAEVPMAEPGAEAAAAGAAAGAAAEATTAAVAVDPDNPMAAEGAAHPSGLKLAHSAEPAKGPLPPTTTYQRGQFTFNRRFIETKFPGFFGVVRRDADRDMVLVFKCARGEYVGQRISRIAANDLHLQVQKGQVTDEVMVPFIEIQEIRLKHKDA